jgi:hypothetical protein
MLAAAHEAYALRVHLPSSSCCLLLLFNSNNAALAAQPSRSFWRCMGISASTSLLNTLDGGVSGRLHVSLQL